ncbi:VENN motif pre-toxin domain-containing protein [Pectobacterium odoriferum]|uniref:VENN motif pre-toxin domain-containing protein n=1 Tax=Pectobacterium odoriferum TaxID=78398 RepID=UPI0032EC49B1
MQDITTLSRDVEHANNALSPIFNKEKEQKRLKQAQLIGEIGAQVMDIVRTEGELKAQKAAEAKGDAKVNRPQDCDSAQEWEAYKKALTESPTYKAEMQKYGTGSDFQRAAQAATAAIQALAGGDIQKAIASGASPYLAQLVKDVTIPKDESKITASDIAANAMAHAVVGAVVAQLSGQDAAAGAIGASSGELIARAIMADQYPGKTANDLTEEEKQSVSALSTLASGLVSGLAGNSTASAASGAQSGRNAVENNYLSSTEKSRQTELNHKQILTLEEQKERDALNRKDAETSKVLIDACMSGSADACTAARQDVQEKQDTYQNLSYQNPKEAQKGYQQIQQLLSGTSAEAIQTQELFNGMVAAYMRTGMTEEAAKSAVGYQLGTMYIIGGIAGIGSGKAADEGLTPGVKSPTSSAKSGGNTSKSSSETYFRVEGGGSGTQTSQNRINVNTDGSVSINSGCSGQLCVSTNGANHAAYYLTNKRQDGSVVVFEVDVALHKQIMEAAVPQRPIPGVPKDPNAPKIVDPTKGQPSVSLELPKVWDRLIEQNSSKARVLTKEEFLNEFGK